MIGMRFVAKMDACCTGERVLHGWVMLEMINPKRNFLITWLHGMCGREHNLCQRLDCAWEREGGRGKSAERERKLANEQYKCPIAWPYANGEAAGYVAQGAATCSAMQGNPFRNESLISEMQRCMMQ